MDWKDFGLHMAVLGLAGCPGGGDDAPADSTGESVTDGTTTSGDSAPSTSDSGPPSTTASTGSVTETGTSHTDGETTTGPTTTSGTDSGSGTDTGTNTDTDTDADTDTDTGGACIPDDCAVIDAPTGDQFEVCDDLYDALVDCGLDEKEASIWAAEDCGLTLYYAEYDYGICEYQQFMHFYACLSTLSCDDLVGGDVDPEDVCTCYHP